MPSLHVIFGLGLALILQTNTRFSGPVGFGEIITLIFILIIFVRKVLSSRPAIIDRPDTLALWYFRVVLIAITPMTVLSWAIDTPGNSFRDLLAYWFVCAILLCLPRTQRDTRAMIYAYLIVTYATIGWHFMLGGEASYHSIRFTGGAKNPNQLALYLVTSFALLPHVPSIWVRATVIALAVFFGLESMSDAFIASALAAAAMGVLLTITPPRLAPFTLPLALLLAFMAISYAGDWYMLQERWRAADEGDSRITLYISALHAWLNTPLSTVFGNGAGSFSGLYGPFGKAEAHNTLLDLAAAAGVFGLVLFPIIPILMFLKAALQGDRFAAAVLTGLMAFALFHFVGRHPIFWVTLALLARLPKASRQTRTMAPLPPSRSPAAGNVSDHGGLSGPVPTSTTVHPVLD